jgi:methylenetetrahydrofolate--tRNA-(uracil-5-)-methyltransferase
VQLRREDRAGQMWSLVGLQTRLRVPEQQRVFSTIPGFGSAEYLRYGSIHRNSYVNSPASLGPALALKDDASVFLAGQMTGVEGYTESLGTGLLAGINLARRLRGLAPAVPPRTTMLGGLYGYLAEADPHHFQPMNANFGLLAPLDAPGRVSKEGRRGLLVERALRDFGAWVETL